MTLPEPPQPAGQATALEETALSIHNEEPKAEPAVLPEDTVSSITPQRQAAIGEQKANYPDTVGWLVVPGTDIDSGVMQSDDLTNEYYLNHDLDGNPDRNGTYSVHTRATLSPGTRDGISQNITVFAHNHDENPNGILFAQLKKFKDSDFATANPYIFFAAEEADMAWEVFAVFDTVKQFDYIEPDPTPWHMQKIIEAATAASIHDYGINVGPDDQILTLSTCSFDVPGVGRLSTSVQNDYRFVVMARLVRPDEPLKETADITANSAILLPNSFAISDVIHLDGESYYLNEYAYENPSIQPVNPANLTLKGVVKNTVLSDEPADWDATFLPVGTEVYVDPAHPQMLLVDMQGQWLPYAPYIDQLEPNAMTLLLEQDGNVVKQLPVDAATDALLWSITDLSDGYVLYTDEPVEPRGNRRVVLSLQFPIYTVNYAYYVGRVEALGDDVMMMRRLDGYCYKDATWFEQLLSLFDA